MKLRPDSRARSMMVRESASSVRPPNIIVPRHKGETFRPDRPRLTYSIGPFPSEDLVRVDEGADARRRGTRAQLLERGRELEHDGLRKERRGGLEADGVVEQPGGT